jgi:hypothetical protein
MAASALGTSTWLRACVLVRLGERVSIIDGLFSAQRVTRADTFFLIVLIQ